MLKLDIVLVVVVVVLVSCFLDFAILFCNFVEKKLKRLP